MTRASSSASSVGAHSAVAVALAQQSARHALLLLLVLSASARKAVVGAYDAAAALSNAKPTSKPKIEIRVQDFSFTEGPTDRPVIEIEATDMKGSEIYDAILAMAFDDSLKDAEPEQETRDLQEQLSSQDALLLVFFVLCFANVVYFGASSFWSLVRRCVRLEPKSVAFELERSLSSFSSGSEQDDAFSSDGESFQLQQQQQQQQEDSSRSLSRKSSERTSELFVRQNALIRLCHLQFVVLAEKLKQELGGSGGRSSGGGGDDVSQMIASLPVSQLDKETVQLADIMQVLEQIPLKEHGLSTERIERQMSAIQQDLAENDLDITGAWTRLQELYKSFQAIQHVIQTRKHLRTRRASRASSLDSMKKHIRRERYAEEVLGELDRMVPTLPVGFTADMFASLGQAIQLQTIPDHRIARAHSEDGEEEEEKEDKPKRD